MNALITFAMGFPIISALLAAFALTIQYLIACRLGRAVLILVRGWPPEHYEDGAYEPEREVTK